MKRTKALFLKKSTGLTIMELLVSLSIVGVLALAAIPMYSNYQTKAKISLEVSNLYALAKKIHEQKQNGNSLEDINMQHTVINDYGTVTRDIGDSGKSIVADYAEIMLRPIGLEFSTKWKCIVSGDNLSESNVPSDCLVGSKAFLRILKENSMIFSENNFELDNNPIDNNSWGKIQNGDDFLGDWVISGGDEELEIWNNFDKISDKRDNVAELDGDRNELIELKHTLNSDNFSNMTLSFDYFSRTGNDSSNFEVYLGGQLVYTHDDFSKGWQNVSIDLDNPDISSSELSIREAGRDESLGALIDLDSLKVTPGDIAE